MHPKKPSLDDRLKICAKRLLHSNHLLPVPLPRTGDGFGFGLPRLPNSKMTINCQSIKNKVITTQRLHKMITSFKPHFDHSVIIWSFKKKKHSSPALHIQDWKNDHSAPLLHALDSLHGCRKPSGSTWNRPPSGGPSTYESPKDRIAKATKIPLGHTGSFFFNSLSKHFMS